MDIQIIFELKTIFIVDEIFSELTEFHPDSTRHAKTIL